MFFNLLTSDAAAARRARRDVVDPVPRHHLRGVLLLIIVLRIRERKNSPEMRNNITIGDEDRDHRRHNGQGSPGH